jgi:NAD(P)-dependent dehydrogenase (short-subunit alcohol dehydrogenase family)
MKNNAENKYQGAILVTGASSGMGRACALRLDRAGFTVFAGVRKEADAQALREAGSDRLHPVILDVTDPASIDLAREKISKTIDEGGLKLAGLVNNAGIGVTAPIELVPLDALRYQYEVNVTGQVAVIQAFLPLIRAEQGRIINVGSVGGKITLPFGGPLCSSKYAFESINDALRMELRPWNIEVVLVAPGSIKTAATNKLEADSKEMLKNFSQEGLRNYASAYNQFVKAFHKREDAGVGPEVMAETVFKALTVPKPRKRYPVGPLSRLLPLLAIWLPTGLFDKIRVHLFGVAGKPLPQ